MQSWPSFRLDWNKIPFIFFVAIFCLVLVTTGPVSAQIVINEIMYAPASGNEDEEYLELYNNSAQEVGLAGWTLGGGIEFTFAPGTVIGAGVYLVVAKSVTAFEALYVVDSISVTGDYAGKLGNGGDGIVLYDDSLLVVDDLIYSDDPPLARHSRRIGSLAGTHASQLAQ